MFKVLSGLTVVLISLLAAMAQAQVTVGEPIPALQINEPGELMLDEGKEKITYQPWSTELLVGKVHVVQYLAGRLGVKDMNKPFTDSLELKDFPADFLHNTTIINLDDTMFGTSNLVNGQLKGNKIKYSYSSIVADREGDGAQIWQLKPKNSAIFLLSPDSKVLFFKDGMLDESDITAAHAIIEQQIELLKEFSTLAQQQPQAVH